MALHLTIVRDEVNRAWPSSQASTVEGQQADNLVASPFVSKEVLEVIGDVLRPKTGAPPQLPAEVDSVSLLLYNLDSSDFEVLFPSVVLDTFASVIEILPFMLCDRC